MRSLILQACNSGENITDGCVSRVGKKEKGAGHREGLGRGLDESGQKRAQKAGKDITSQHTSRGSVGGLEGISSLRREKKKI